MFVDGQDSSKIIRPKCNSVGLPTSVFFILLIYFVDSYLILLSFDFSTQNLVLVMIMIIIVSICQHVAQVLSF